MLSIHQEANPSMAAQLRAAGGTVTLWLAVAGLWTTVSAVHESAFVLLAAAAVLAAALPGADRRLLAAAAIWTVLAGAVAWQPGLDIGTLAWSLAAVLGLRFIAWPAWQQPHVIPVAKGDERPKGLLQRGRASAFALMAGAAMYMLTGVSPVASWGMFIVSAAIGGAVWYFRRGAVAAGAAALAGGWVVNLMGDVLIADQLWQGIIHGVHPAVALSALAGAMAGGSWIVGLGAALPQVGLDWPVRTQKAGQPATRPLAPAQRLHRGLLVCAAVLAVIALIVPEFGATFVRAADGGVWAASLFWWGLATLLGPKEGRHGEQ